MKVWRLLLQSVGAMNLLLSAWGCCLGVTAVVDVCRRPATDPRLPYFHVAFWTMTSIDAAFLPVVVFVSVMLLRLRPRAAMAHTCLFLAMLAYTFAVGSSWLSNQGESIASASGIGNMGIAPLLVFPVPFVYPVISILCVNIASLRLKRNSRTQTLAIKKAHI